MDDFKSDVDRRFEAVDRRFDAVDRRFDTIDRRFDRVDEKFDALNRTIMQIGGGIIGTLIVATGSLIAAQL